MQLRRTTTLVLALLVLFGACGGDDDTAGDTTVAATAANPAPTTTTAAAATTTTAAPAETTTTTAATTTTTAAPTSSAAPVTAEDAEARATAKVQAAVDALPEGWTAEVEQIAAGATDSDEVFAPCSGPDAFDLATLDDVSLAIVAADMESPNAASLFGPLQATIEARVFESPAVAAEAFAVLETVLGTEEGRNCVAEEFLAQLSGGSPGAEAAFSIEDVEIPGADVAARLVFEVSADEISLSFRVDLAASRNGDCTVFASYFSFGDDFDEAARDATFAAAAGA